MNFTINQMLAFIICFVGFYPSIACAAPYLRPDTIYADCCGDEPSIDERLFAEPLTESVNPDNENLLYIPFTEMIIRDFGIHKYVINRNIKSLMNYHTDSHLVNIITKSLNQSTFEITRLVLENRAEFDSMAGDEFTANFMDFWVAYRLIQLFEFSSNNLDILANIFKDAPISKNNTEL